MLLSEQDQAGNHPGGNHTPEARKVSVTVPERSITANCTALDTRKRDGSLMTMVGWRRCEAAFELV
jgi:hypothetical protein